MLNSNFRRLGSVTLPYTGRQEYMHSFDLSAPCMAHGYEDYLSIVTALCGAAGAHNGTAYMTVDEKIVTAGTSQRRPAPHVDGCFMPEVGDWSHGPGPSWAHYCNQIPVPRMSVIVAASVVGCRAWRGTFNAYPSDSGDLSHIINQLGEGDILDAGVGYLLSPDCVHESMVFPRATQRTFLRIALPVPRGEFP